MGTNSILKAKERILDLIMSVNDAKECDSIHTLCHAYEVLTQCEHMSVAMNGKPSNPLFDFPSDFDLE